MSLSRLFSGDYCRLFYHRFGLGSGSSTTTLTDSATNSIPLVHCSRAPHIGRDAGHRFPPARGHHRLPSVLSHLGQKKKLLEQLTGLDKNSVYFFVKKKKASATKIKHLGRCYKTERPIHARQLKIGIFMPASRLSYGEHCRLFSH